jgi:hypothetical protein
MGNVFESPEKEPRRVCAEAWGRRNRSRATGPRATGGPLRLGDELRGRTTTPNLVRADACERFATQACGAR